MSDREEAHMKEPTRKQRLTALRGSIRKWERIVLGTGKDKGSRNCPLCKLYYNRVCIGCPVFEKSGKRRCDGTPYEVWSIALRDDRDDLIPDSIIDQFELPSMVFGPRTMRAAIMEHAFLVDLLEEEENK